MHHSPRLENSSLVMTVCCMALAVSSYGQTATNPPIVQLRRTVYNFREASQVCVSVQPDGAFQLERVQQKMDEKPRASIARGQLSTEEVRDLRRILENDSLRKLRMHRGMPQGDVRMEGSEDNIQITIPREASVQEIQYFGPRDGNFPTAIDPLLDWARRLEREPSARVKKAKALCPQTIWGEPRH